MSGNVSARIIDSKVVSKTCAFLWLLILLIYASARLLFEFQLWWYRKVHPSCVIVQWWLYFKGGLKGDITEGGKRDESVIFTPRRECKRIQWGKIIFNSGSTMTEIGQPSHGIWFCMGQSDLIIHINRSHCRKLKLSGSLYPDWVRPRLIPESLKG